jgi:hypothetical protein
MLINRTLAVKDAGLSDRKQAGTISDLLIGSGSKILLIRSCASGLISFKNSLYKESNPAINCANKA